MLKRNLVLYMKLVSKYNAINVFVKYFQTRSRKNDGVNSETHGVENLEK